MPPTLSLPPAFASGAEATVHLVWVSGADGRALPAVVKVARAGRLAQDPLHCTARAQMAREARLLYVLGDFEGTPRFMGEATGPKGEPAFAMEAILGEDLAALLARVGRFPLRPALELIARLCQHLYEASQRIGFVHGDLKPRNLLLTPAGRVVLVDLGCSRADGQDDVAPTVLLAGDAHYTAPEVWGRKETSEATDAYAIGVLLHQLLTGRPGQDPRLREASEDLLEAQRLDVGQLVQALTEPEVALRLRLDEAASRLVALAATVEGPGLCDWALSTVRPLELPDPPARASAASSESPPWLAVGLLLGLTPLCLALGLLIGLLVTWALPSL